MPAVDVSPVRRRGLVVVAVGVRVAAIVFLSPAVGDADVAVVEMQAARLGVVVRRFVQVGRTGHEAKGHV